MTSECITSEQMAALVEQKLPYTESKRLFAHLSQCNGCYEEYLMLLELQDADEKDAVVEAAGEAGVDNARDNEWKDIPLIIDLGFHAAGGEALAAAAGDGHDHDHGQIDDPKDDDRFHGMRPTHAVNSFGERVSHHTNEQVHQLYPDTCAIKAQQLILKDYGINLTEDQLRKEAIEKGWYVQASLYHSGGTPMHNVGKLMEEHGIRVHQNYGGNVFSLVNELAQGHEVIVDVDAHALWAPGITEKLRDVFIGRTPNHALIVAGINTADERDVKVILKDPGTGDVGKEYSLGHFLDAWKDSNYFMVSTNEPVPGMKNFNYEKGHIEYIGHYSYQDFQNMHQTDLNSHDQGAMPLAATEHTPGLSGAAFLMEKMVDFFDHHPNHPEVNNHDTDTHPSGDYGQGPTHDINPDEHG